MADRVDIFKAGGLLITNKRCLAELSRKRTMYVVPGGKLEKGETPKQALVRELEEELGIIVEEEDLTEFNTYVEPAAGEEDKIVKMIVFIVNAWKGAPSPNNEVIKIKWVNTQTKDVEFGGILKHKVLPELKRANLID